MTTEKEKAKYLAMIANGADPTAARLSINLPSRVAKAWLQEKDFQEARALVAEAVQDAVQTSLVQHTAEMSEIALNTVKEAMRDDPKIALSWLKETGALRTAGNLAGLDTSAAPVQTEGGVSITINTAPPGEPGGAIIEAEVVE